MRDNKYLANLAPKENNRKRNLYIPIKGQPLFHHFQTEKIQKTDKEEAFSLLIYYFCRKILTNDLQLEFKN